MIAKYLSIVFFILLLSVIVLGALCWKDIVHDIKFVEYEDFEISKKYWKEHQGEVVEWFIPASNKTPNRNSYL